MGIHLQGGLRRVKEGKEGPEVEKKKSKSIILYNINDNTVYGEFNSITEAAHHINCNEKTIRRSLQTNKKILLKR